MLFRSRDIVRGISKKTGKPIPPEVEKFFKALESGKCEEIDAQWKQMANRSGQYTGSTHAPELDPFWPAILDAYGVAEQAHDWPAKELLEYGESILSAVKPGAVYVGGTDNGRWIPELMDAGNEENSRIIITQNALADSRYLEYIQTLYSDRFQCLNESDSQRAFSDYLQDAQRRLEHDRDFPNEPKQLRPGEDVKVIDNKVQVSGQVAVMTINEMLMRAMMEKNPDLSFAMQESSPMTGLYADATRNGPLLEQIGRAHV